MSTSIEDVVRDVQAAQIETNGHAIDDDVQPFTMLPKRTRAEMRTRRLDFVCPESRGLPRGLVTGATGPGGGSKTTFVTQMLSELGRGVAPFGEETLKPTKFIRSLYIGAEDSEPLFNEMTLRLLASEDDTLPFDVLLLEEQGDAISLDAQQTRRLARFVEEHGPYDVIALDPKSALVPEESADAVKNQFTARKWQRMVFGALRRACPTAAFILVDHDTKSGSPMSGSGDFINFGRCTLQFRAGGSDGVPEDVPEGSIEIRRVKDNCGFRWKRMILSRDPHTLLLSITKTEAAYGASSRPTRQTQAELEQYLATQALRLLEPAPVPDDDRLRSRVEALLVSHCARDGVKVSGRNIDRFLDVFCKFRSERRGRSTVKILEAVTDPSAEEEARYGS